VTLSLYLVSINFVKNNNVKFKNKTKKPGDFMCDAIDLPEFGSALNHARSGSAFAISMKSMRFRYKIIQLS
jgi:hypothetical protein